MDFSLSYRFIVLDKQFWNCLADRAISHTSNLCMSGLPASQHSAHSLHISPHTRAVLLSQHIGGIDRKEMKLVKYSKFSSYIY